MECDASEAAEAVDAVLQGVLDDTQQWAARDSRTSPVHQQQKPLVLPEPQQADGADQALQPLLAGPASSPLSAPHAASAPAPSPPMSPVISAINPLFLPAQSSRPQSAQLQKTLSAMCDQLSALEESMQQLPKDGAASTAARRLSVQPAEVKAMADLSQQPGAPSYGNGNVGGSKICNCGSAHATNHSQLDVCCTKYGSQRCLLRLPMFASCKLPRITQQHNDTPHPICDADEDKVVGTSAAASDSNAVPPPHVSTSADAVTASAALASRPEAVTDQPADRAKDSTLPSDQDAAPLPSDIPATAAGTLSTAKDQPAAYAEELSTAAADTTTSEPRADWAPSPPMIPAARRVAPRPSAFFRHSISAMPHAAHSQHHHATGLDNHYIPALHHSHPKLDTSAVGKDAGVWGSNSKEGISKRPATAGPAISPTASHQVLREQPSRPQTAAAADRVWPGVRYIACDPNLDGLDLKVLAS